MPIFEYHDYFMDVLEVQASKTVSVIRMLYQMTTLHSNPVKWMFLFYLNCNVYSLKYYPGMIQN
jgi:hypothetical protein